MQVRLAIFVLATGGAFAQHVPIGPVSPIGLGPIGPRTVAPRPSPGGRIPPTFYPGYFGGYGYGGYDAPPTQNVVIVQQPQPVVFLPPAPPPEPIHAEISEYRPPANPPASNVQGETKAFAIVLKSGSTRDASAVSFQEGALLIVDSEGEHQRIGLDTVDRDATRRINRERGLQLQLPVR